MCYFIFKISENIYFIIQLSFNSIDSSIFSIYFINIKLSFILTNFWYMNSNKSVKNNNSFI